MRRPVLSSIAALVIAFAVAGTAAAKEISGVIAPFDAEIGQPTTVSLTLTMDGQRLPADFGGDVIIAFRDEASGAVIEGEATYIHERWQATLTFPHDGTWTALAWLQLGPDRVPFKSLSGASQAIIAAPSGPLTMPLLAGVGAVAAMILLVVALRLRRVRGKRPLIAQPTAQS